MENYSEKYICVECKEKKENIWCPHPECLESIECFSTEDKLNEHVKLKHNNTVFVEGIGGIIIPERNTIYEIYLVLAPGYETSIKKIQLTNGDLIEID